MSDTESTQSDTESTQNETESRQNETERAQEVLGGILERMGIEAEIDLVQEDDRYRLDIKCEEPDRLIGRRGQVIDALQHLVGKIVFRGRPLGANGAPQKPIVIDTDGYRERYAEKLCALADRLASKAEETGEIVALDPMSAYDRRIMHMALAERGGVTTRSEGEGNNRHMLIVPASAES